MPKLESIIAIINSELQTKLFNTARFQGGVYFDSVARPLTTTEDSGGQQTTTVRPAIVDNEGQATALDIKDENVFTLYHFLSSPPLYEDAPEEEFGPPGTGIRETCDFSLVFSADRNRLQVTPEEVVAGIYAFLPRQITHAQEQNLSLLGFSLTPGNAETDIQKVMASQYSGLDIVVDPGFIYVSVNYKLITYYSKSCFSLC